MDDLGQRADFRIDSITADTQRSGRSFHLEIEARARNNNVEVYSIEPELTFEFPSGKTLHINHVTVPLGTTEELNSNGTKIQVRADTTLHELERIEEYREGDDFDISLTLHLRGKRGRDDGMGAGTFECEYPVTAAEWSTVLNDLDYHSTRSFEVRLGTDNTRLRDTLATANARLNRAEQLHNEGDYESAVRACRDTIESIEELDNELKTLIDPQKWERFENSMGGFRSGFVGLLSHSQDKTNTHPTLKRDSDLVLGTTKSYLRYVTTAIKEESE